MIKCDFHCNVFRRQLMVTLCRVLIHSKEKAHLRYKLCLSFSCKCMVTSDAMIIDYHDINSHDNRDTIL